MGVQDRESKDCESKGGFWVFGEPAEGSVLILLGYNFKETGDRNNSLYFRGRKHKGSRACGVSSLWWDQCD